MEHRHRGGGQDSAQFPADDRAVLVHPLDKAVRPRVPRALLLGDERREGGKNQVAAYLGGACRRHRAVFLQRVAARSAAAPFGAYRLLSAHLVRRLRLPLGRRGMDVPPAPAELDGGRVQQRERILHAGDPAHRERVFRQSAHPFLVQEKDVARLDKRREPLPRLYRLRDSGQRQVLCGGQFLHQAAD